LIIDDITIHSISKLADFIFEDEMFDFVALCNWTAIFRRTTEPSFPPDEDNWQNQHYNRTRRHGKSEYFKAGKKVDFFSSLNFSGLSFDEFIHTNMDKNWLKTER
jgi:hypothetical protein